MKTNHIKILKVVFIIWVAWEWYEMWNITYKSTNWHILISIWLIIYAVLNIIEILLIRKEK